MNTNTKMMSKELELSINDECIGCETGCDNDGSHRDESGNYHPECCTRAAELEKSKSTMTPSSLQHPASPYVVYGNTGSLPEPSSIEDLLYNEIEKIKERHQEGIGMWENMALLSPAFGMIGTLIGLVNMLQQLDDPTTIGPAMAVAILTTLYGSLIANVVAIPISKKLARASPFNADA